MDNDGNLPEWYRNKETPEWHRRAYDRNREEFNDPKTEEYWKNRDRLVTRALLGLYEGELLPLVEYLKSECSNMDADLALEVVSMIEGDGRYADFIIETKKHPKLSGKDDRHAWFNQMRRYQRTSEIGFFIANIGGHRLNNEAAIRDAMGHFRLGRSTVKEEWGNFIKIFKRRIEMYGGDPGDRELINKHIDQYVIEAKIRLKKHSLNL